MEGDRAAVLSRTSFVQRATGRTLSLRLVNFIRVQDGKIIEFREFSDTFDAVEQTVGAGCRFPRSRSSATSPAGRPVRRPAAGRHRR